MRIDRLRGSLALLVFAAILLAMAWWSLSVPAATPDPAWLEFREQFVNADGRVIDTGSGGVSHSEGQAWAMLFAETNNDRETFNLVWKWTRENLRRDDGALFAWRFDPSTKPAVQDQNNSTDADLTIAWALMRASERWDDKDYAEASKAIRDGIREKLSRTLGKRHLLLPGLQGFERDGGFIINPSYLVVPALQAFARLEPDKGWDKVLNDGLVLLLDARFGRYGLAPDWLLVSADGRLAPAPGWPPRFGFDAARIPLYLIWAGIDDAAQLKPYRSFWSCPDSVCKQGKPPAWVDLATGATADFAAPEGVLAIRSLVLGDSAAIPARTDKRQDYYSSALLLLTHVAARERNAPAPVPENSVATQPVT